MLGVSSTKAGFLYAKVEVVFIILGKEFSMQN
jgi:hypothetical protein